MQKPGINGCILYNIPMKSFGGFATHLLKMIFFISFKTESQIKNPLINLLILVHCGTKTTDRVHLTVRAQLEPPKHNAQINFH